MKKIVPFKMDSTTTIVKVLCKEQHFVRNITDTCNDDDGEGKKSGDDQSTYTGKVTNYNSGHLAELPKFKPFEELLVSLAPEQLQKLNKIKNMGAIVVNSLEELKGVLK